MKKLSKEKFLLAKKMDAKNERAKGKALRWKHSEPPRRSEPPGLSVNNVKSKHKKVDSVPLESANGMTFVKSN